MDNDQTIVTLDDGSVAVANIIQEVDPNLTFTADSLRTALVEAENFVNNIEQYTKEWHDNQLEYWTKRLATLQEVKVVSDANQAQNNNQGVQ